MKNLWRYFTLTMVVSVLSCTAYAETIQKERMKARHGQTRHLRGDGHRIVLELSKLEGRPLSPSKVPLASRLSADRYFLHRGKALPARPRAAGVQFGGPLVGLYWDLGNRVKLGAGYNFSSFSDDVADLTLDRDGLFISLIGSL